MTKHTGRCNDIGARFNAKNPAEHLQQIRIYNEGSTVHIWVCLAEHANGEKLPSEVLQHLTPQEAMDLAAGLRRSAIRALEQGAA